MASHPAAELLSPNRPAREQIAAPHVGSPSQLGEPVRQAVGEITVVQESRFRLDQGDGRSLHFTLHRNSRIEPQDLPGLKGVPVAVRYDGAPRLQGLVAFGVARVG